jgi:Leucine-rich repeat (LRR) protein
MDYIIWANIFLLIAALVEGTGSAVSVIKSVSSICIGNITVQEMEALRALFDSTDGTNWINQHEAFTHHWHFPASLDAPCGEAWYGLSCLPVQKNASTTNIANCSVTSISLSSNNLVGSIPPQLNNVTTLRSLDLYNNYITGSLEIDELVSLATLDLGFNYISGVLPATIAKLSSMVSMELFVNYIFGTIPASIGLLTTLHTLDIAENYLSGPIVPEIGDLPQLTTLQFGSNLLFGSIPTQLGKAVQLQILDVDTNSCYGPIPTQLGFLGDLEELYLDSNILSGEIPTCIGNLTRLEIIDFSDNYLSGSLVFSSSLTELYVYSNFFFGSIPTGLWNTLNLQFLDMSTNSFSGQISFELGLLTNLEELSLGANFFSAELPTSLGYLSLLNTLSIFTNHLTGPVVSEIGNLQLLTTLQLDLNMLSGFIPTQLGRSANLQILDVEANSLSGPIPSQLGYLIALEELYLDDNFLSREIPTCIGNLTRLTTLNVGENYLSGTLISELGNLSLLTGLYISTNLFSGAIPSELGQLAALNVFYFDDNQFTELPDTMAQMEFLEIVIGSSNAIRQLPRAFLGLSRLNELYLDNNLLTGALPDNMNTSGVSYLSLYNNSMTGPLPESSLFLEVYLGSNKLSGTLPPELYAAYSNLNVFSVAYNSLTGSLVSLSSTNRRYDCYLQDNLFTGSFPAAKGFSQLNMEDNYLGGSLPTDFLKGIIDLLIGTNYFSGSISENYEYASDTLFANDNLLSGSIPPSLAGGLFTLDLSNNSLVGEFPSIFCGVNLLEEAYLAENMLTGPLVFPLGGCQLNILDLTNNSLNGTVPNEIGTLNSLLLQGNHFTGMVNLCTHAVFTVSLTTLQLGSNMLSGNTSWLSCLVNLTVLGLENNSFTGSIDALENLTSIQEIIVSNNRLSGTLPAFISRFAQLKVVIVASNRFIGNPDVIFNPETQSTLTAVDISDNGFSGSLPSTVFMLPILESFASIKTCFSGSIPSTICGATALKVLLMDGITSGKACQKRFILDTLFRADAYISTKGPVVGGIPACIWTDLPLLASLHLSSNGLTGSLNIPDESYIRNLSSIVLSYNQLTGTIPPALLSVRFRTLELSNNRFKGTLDGNLQLDNATVFLANNRLSGFIPVSFSSSSADLNILQGNLFDCNPDQPKPSRDQHASSTACGSAALNNALIAWGSIAGVLCSVGVAVAVWRLLISKIENPRQQLEKLRSFVSAGKACCHTIVNTTALNTLELEQLYLAIRNHFSDLLPSRLTIPGTALYDYVSVLFHLLSFQSIFVVMGSLLICIPMYLTLKFVSDGIFATHTYQYQWLVSSAFLSGQAPAICLLIFWVITMVLFVAAVGKFDIARQAWQQTHVNEATVSEDGSFEKEVVRWAKGINHTLVACCGFLLLNVLILSSVNAGYLYILLSGNFAVEVVLAAQMSVSLFKVAWDLLGIPTGIKILRTNFQEHEFDSARFVQLKFWCNALNSVVLPFTISLFANSLCFLDLFIPQSVINENFVYNLANRVKCVTVMIPPPNQTVSNDDLDPNPIPPPSVSTCLSFGASQQYATEFDPPFTYSYQCGSSIITSYVPVLIYSCAFRVVAALTKLLQDAYFPRCDCPRWSRQTESVRALESSTHASSLRDGTFLSHLLVECVVLLTFGASSPPVACTTWLCVLIELFVHVQDVAAFVATTSSLRSSSNPAEMDSSVSEVRALAGAGVWPCINLASIYWALQVFDMVGDTDAHNPAQASWAPILACIVPLCFRGLLDGWHVRRRVLDAATSKTVKQQSVVTINMMHMRDDVSNGNGTESLDGDIDLTEFTHPDKSGISAQDSNSNFSV